jgi:hypothetical protein
MGVSTWSPEVAQRFRELLQDRKRSYGQCADILSREFNLSLTRNACIGWAGRNGIPPRPIRSIKRGGQRSKARSGPKLPMPVLAPVRPAVAIPHPPGYRPSLLELGTRECKWPYGEGPFVFCAAPRSEGSSYCAEHARIAYTGKR